MSKEKDIAEKILEDYNDVFADIVNSFLFDGQEVVKEDELENAATVSQLKIADDLHEQERDTIKYWRHGTIIIAAFGTENQSWDDPTIPLRLFSYDGSVYKSQANRYLSEREKKQPVSPFYPAITLVLYFGKRRWYGPRTLRACFKDLPVKLEPYIPDYPVHLVEVAFLPPEQIQRMKSDFRLIADYLSQTRTGGTYIPSHAQITHVDETLKLMGAITRDDRFRETMNAFAQAGKKEVSMCDVIDSYIDKGRAEGREEGRAEGREESRKEYEAILADRDRALADRDREIRELKRRLGLI